MSLYRVLCIEDMPSAAPPRVEAAGLSEAEADALLDWLGQHWMVTSGICHYTKEEEA